MEEIAEVRNVTKTLDAVTALDKINLQIERGEILALLGPNGSGKTTLLKILALLIRPTSGDMFFEGVKADDQNIERLRMEATMVFQKTVIFNTTVFNNVAYGLKVRNVPKNEFDERISEALRLVKLDGFQKRHAKRLSGGEQQRVALARALVLSTKLLLLDEPTANLDPKNAAIIEEIIETVNKKFKTTIVIATHNMFQAKKLPHRVALMINGRINEIGTATEIFGRLSRNLASFAAVENTFTGTATIGEDGTASIDIGNGIRIAAAINKAGEVSAFVSPEDIIVSKKSFESSARNSFMGRVTDIQDLGSLVRLRVDIGKPFTVQITKRSFNEMELNLDSDVILAFKASSVQII